MVQRGKKLLSLLLTAAMVASLVVVPAFATDTSDTTGTTNETQNGQDTSVGGEEGSSGGTTNANPEASEKPFQVGEQSYATLAEAVDKVAENGTIEVTGNVTLTSSLYLEKSITIKGTGNATISRSTETFETADDSTRIGYNPAMIEVHKKAVLTLENITLDDCNYAKGTYFIQENTKSKGNSLTWKVNKKEYGPVSNNETVQDGILAIYNGDGSIVLDSGAVLANFGGMSAVRLSGGTLTMKAGSRITGGGDTSKNGVSYGEGAAGAVWIQGGELVMEEGSEITGVNGRAVYVDGGSATVNGTISNITGNMNMWQNESGVAIHVRNNGSAVLGETGVIDNIKGDHAGYRGAVTTNGSRGEGLWDFEAKEGSVIKNVTGFPTLYSNYGTELLNGSITDCSNDFIIGGFAQKTTIGETGVIENCTAKNGAANAIVYTSNASKIFLKGTVQNNTASYAFYIINQSGGGASLDMYDGALISKTTGTGVYINASGCSLNMHGGTISENGSYGVYVREKANSAATFTMDGGEIINNKSYGVYNSTNSGKTGYVNITGGEISGNGSEYSPYQVYISGANSEDTMSRVQITPGVIQAGNGKQANVNTSFGAWILDADYPEVYFGNAKSAASDKIKALVSEYQKEAGAENSPYITAGSYALWFKPTTETLHFTVKRNASINPNNYLKVGYIPLKEDGTPTDDAQLTVVDVTNANPVDVTLSGLTANYPYALMWIVPNEDATGVLKLTTETATVAEVRDEESGELQDSYPVDYTFTYQPKNLRSSIQVDDEFTATITLDEHLNYIAANLTNSQYYEQVGDPVYNADSHTVTLKFKVLKTVFAGTTATINLSATFDGGLFDTVKQLETNAAITSTLTGGKQIDLKTAIPCVTKLVPLGSYSVTFNSNGGNEVEPQVIKQGNTATQPANPTRDGYTFNGWTLNGSAYDFTAPVTENITLVAQWTQNSGGGGTGGGGGGGGGGGIDIPDDPTPLGGDLQLNREDHFAYVSGYPDSSVQPGGHITREEVATIFYRLLTEQSKAIYGVTTNNFNDVEAERWSNEAISTLANAQVLQGYADGGFHPGDPITRAEFTAIVTRFDEVDSAPASPFSDTAGHWAEDVIAFAASKNWVGGYPDGSFRPQSDITRAEAMTMINNILDRLVDEEGILAEARQWPDNAKDAWYYYAVQEATNSHDYTRRSADGIVENWTALR